MREPLDLRPPEAIGEAEPQIEVSGVVPLFRNIMGVKLPPSQHDAHVLAWLYHRATTTGRQAIGGGYMMEPSGRLWIHAERRLGDA